METVQFFKKNQKKESLLWSFQLDPFKVLFYSGFLVLLGYVCFLVYGLSTLDSSVSVSEIIEISKGTAISFTFLVVLHAYGVYSYLIIIYQYVHQKHFVLLVICCISYIVSLIVLSYLPIEHTVNNVKMHHVFGFIAYFFALISTISHKHSFFPPLCIDDETNQAKAFLINQDEDGNESLLVYVEILIIGLVILFGSLFYFGGFNWAEILFIFLIIIDKQIKIFILLELKLIRRQSKLIYNYVNIEDNLMKANF